MLSTFFKVLKYRAPLIHILKHLNYVRRDYHQFVTEYEELVNPPKLKTKNIIQKKTAFSVSIGVMAYNEEHWIGPCLNALLKQKTSDSVINEIFVVSSGSTDRTNEIVLKMARDDYRIKLIEQFTRQGKASAINEFLARATGDIAIVSSADLVAHPETVKKLVKPFSDETIGMTGCHPIPVNSGSGVVAFFVNKLWGLHHLMALDNPKCGEMIAFRNIIEKIPNFTAVDEAAIESIFNRLNYEIRYVPEATVNNKGPETIGDFIKQRKRIASGHMHLKSTVGYRVSTYSSKSIFSYTLKSQKWNIRDAFKMVLLILVEGYCRLSGKLSYNLKDKNPFIWDISLSTKK